MDMDDLQTPPDFPTWLPVHREPYRNWVGAIQLADVWTCEPRNTADVVLLANWAKAHGYRLRPRGRMHNFSPLTVSQQTAAGRVLLMDTTKHLAGMHLVSTQPAAVRVGTGATMDALLAYLESHNMGLAAVPAIGDLSVGGVLAIGAHGTGIPIGDDNGTAGHLYGTLSNLVVALTAVVWDKASGAYVARTFDRAEPDCAALLVHLGRAFLTEVTLRVGANYTLRCVSGVTIPGRAIFAPPATSSTQTFAALSEQAGRAEAIWFPYSDGVWMKTWTAQASKQPGSRPATAPYNYPFSDNIPEPIAKVAARLAQGAPELAPQFDALQFANVVHGLAATRSADLSGPSKNLLLYVRPSILRYTTNGHAICARRADIQRVVHEFTDFVRQRLRAYQQQSRYPLNGPIEIRVTALDDASHVGVSGALPPVLSAAVADSNHPEWDVAIWLDVLTFPGTQYADKFYREIEEFIFANYRAPYAQARVEWSKGWAYTANGPWTDRMVMTRTVPDTFGKPWRWAKDRLTAYDPHRIYSNEFLDQIL